MSISLTGWSSGANLRQALAKGRMIGWFFVDQVIGKHELITYALGINADGKVRWVK